jgi:hypothetical protein
MSVFANGRSILHKGHGKTQLAVAPDVCKTPSPGGPIPIPYPNMSPDSNLTKGAETVEIQGNPTAHTDAQLSRSSGDEPGTAGGVVSSKNMGAFGWPAGSMDVTAEGKGVVRLMDSILTNGNAYNSTGVDLGTPELGYSDDAECPREDCKLGRVLSKHRVPETPTVANLCAQLVKEAESLSKTQLGRYGRMVGVGQCECGRTYKAISGPGMSPPGTNPPGIAVGDAVAAPGDSFMASVIAVNPGWQCAALKIMSNAGGHKIIAVSEKWVGRKKPDGTRFPKYVGGNTAFHFPVRGADGALVGHPDQRSDRVQGAPPENEIPTGGSVPSCGKCQVFLPALICEMNPC